MDLHAPRRIAYRDRRRVRARQLTQRRSLRTAQKRQQDPVRHALLLLHRLWPHGAGGHGAKIGKMLRRARAGADHDELFLRARHGDVQHAQLLGLCLAAQLTLKCEPRSRGVFDRAFRVHADRPEAVFRVDEHGALEVHAAERAREVRKDHDRKFQSLGLVDAHDAHALRGVRGLRHGRLAGFQLLAQMPDKGEEPPPAAALKFLRQREERTKIFPACGSSPHRAEHRRDMAALIERRDQLGERERPRALAQLAQQREEPCGVLAPVRGECIVKIAARRFRAQLGEPVRRKAEKRRAQHGDERHVLPRVVQYFEQREGHGDLHRFVKAAVALGGTVQPAALQRAAIVGKPCAGRAHEDDDVLLPHRARLVRFIVLHREAAGDEPLYVVRGEARLGPGRTELFRVALLRGHLHKMELRAAVGVLGIARPDVQGLILAVVQLAHFPGKDVAEHEVRRVQHRIARAEVFAQKELRALALRRVGGVRVAQIVVEENTRVGEAEAVDALLDVADGEEVFSFTGNGGEDAVLHLVRVLIFVHHDLAVALRDRSRKVGGLSVRAEEQVDGLMLLVGEVRRVAAALLLLISAGKIRRQL